jgi:hypothetical protein
MIRNDSLFNGDITGFDGTFTISSTAATSGINPVFVPLLTAMNTDLNVSSVSNLV